MRKRVTPNALGSISSAMTSVNKGSANLRHNLTTGMHGLGNSALRNAIVHGANTHANLRRNATIGMHGLGNRAVRNAIVHGANTHANLRRNLTTGMHGLGNRALRNAIVHSGNTHANLRRNLTTGMHGLGNRAVRNAIVHGGMTNGSRRRHVAEQQQEPPTRSVSDPSETEEETRQGAPKGHFDDLRDMVTDLITNRDDRLHDMRDAYDLDGDDGPITDGGADEAGPARDDDGPITDGGADEAGPARDDDGPITDGGADEAGPARDDDGVPAGGDESADREPTPDETADAVVDGVLGVLDWLGHAAPGHIYPDVYWNPSIWVAQPNYVPATAVVPENPLVAEANPVPAVRVIVVNPETNEQTIAFVLDGQAHRLEPAKLLEESTVDAMIVEFDRGADFGTARYSLTEGVYEFTRTENGWDLVRKTFTVTLDNTANAQAFHYLVGGEPATVEAGGSQTHTGRFPIGLAFDRGNDAEPANVALPSGTFKIAVSQKTGLWDLFAVPEPEGVAGATSP